MCLISDDTICAIATAPGGAARGIVRISGPNALAVAGELVGLDSNRQVRAIARPAALPCEIRVELANHARAVPCDLFLWPGHRSYTREPVAELHMPGSPPILEAVVNAACRKGARLAQPGEFTLRAFLAGRLDLTQAEAVLGVIDASADADLSAALCQLAGGLAKPLHQLREDLLQLLAELEAGLDFVEEDIEFVTSAEVVSRLRSADELLQTVEAQFSERHTASYTPQIALVGLPNAGKSSLFNALIQRFGTGQRDFEPPDYAAIVSPEAGTTRDYLTGRVRLSGIDCELIDTAGVETGNGRETRDRSAIEHAAEALTADRKRMSRLVVHCLECTQISANSGVPATCLDDEYDLLVVTKSDLQQIAPSSMPHIEKPVVVTSSRTGAGTEDFAAAVQRLLVQTEKPDGRNVVATTADRCRESVRLARQSLNSAAVTSGNNGGPEIVSAELRAALTELGTVVGAVYTDDLLDRIFSTFCIGK